MCHEDLPSRYADRLAVQAVVFRAGEGAVVEIDSLITNHAGGVTVWLKSAAPARNMYADEVDVYAFLRILGVDGHITAKREGVSYGSYKADWSLNGSNWKVSVYGGNPTESSVPDEALMAAWRARGDNGCKDCTERPCVACAAHLTGIAAAVLTAGAR